MDDSAVIVQVNVCHINRHLTNGLVICYTKSLLGHQLCSNSIALSTASRIGKNQFDLRLKLMIMFGLISNV